MSSDLYRRLVKVMEENRLFLDQNLTRQALAKAAGTNRTYLSKALSDSGTNFYDFVNSYRLEYALGLLVREEFRNTDIEEIAVVSGFPDGKMFSKCLKKSAGFTAGAYREYVLDGTARVQP